MTPESIADHLHLEAKDILFDRGIDLLLRRYGEVSYTGSYLLDLMAWNDIDIYIASTDLAQIADLARELTLLNFTSIVKVEKDLYLRKDFLPKGIYLGVKLNIGNYPLPWKLDIWALKPDQIKKKQTEMQKIQSELTPELRSLILSIKQKIMLPKGRTPSFSSFHIYTAVFQEGLRNQDEIINFLQSKNIIS